MVRFRWIALLLCGAALIAGCGNDNSDSNSSADAESSSFKQLPDPPTSPPTTLSVTEPMKAKPESGKTIGMVVGPAPIYQYYIKQAKIAAKELGWTIRPFVYSTSAAGAVQGAIGAKVDAIYGVSLVREALKSQLESARKAGIPVFNQGTPEASEPDKLYFTTSHNNLEIVEDVADWIINDSKGKANVALFDLPEIPYFKPSTDKMRSRLEQACPDCKFEEVKVTLQDFSTGKIPAQTASYLQSHPDVDYVAYQYGDMMVSILPPLKSAGLLDKVKIICVDAGTKQVLQGIIDGDVAASGVAPNEATPWWGMDYMARFF